MFCNYSFVLNLTNRRVILSNTLQTLEILFFIGALSGLATISVWKYYSNYQAVYFKKKKLAGLMKGFSIVNEKNKCFIFHSFFIWFSYF
jgi:hypothetical protein